MRPRWRGRRSLLAVAIILAAVLLLRERPDPEAERPAAPAGSPAGSPAEAETSAAPPRRPAGQRAVVAEVVDGDTLVLGDGTRVRLVQIDAPELSGGECYAQEATAELRRMASPGTTVRLTADPALDRVDRYGRALRYVWRGSTNVNVALVRRGAASVWFFDGDRGRYASRLLAAAEKARDAGRGLWATCPETRLDPTRGVETRAAPAASAPFGAVGASRGCHPAYRGACVPIGPPDVDCADVGKPVRVVGRDDHQLDSDGDGGGRETW